ncbi:MAG: molybdopterin-dependent oxidoreductase [Lutispora sp.]|nr:molybdopterin-dependent oxidoreductase [Lutispora sp.]MDD4834078.1 molybdopterin-dependent oxidoreductase [Lutispora sp.]
MRRKRKALVTLLIVILSLTMLTACQPKVSTEPDSGIIETEAKIDEAAPEAPKPAEESKEAEEKSPPDTPIASPAEPNKKDEAEATAPKPDDKSSLLVEGTGVTKTITLSLDDLKAMKDSYFEDDFFSLNSYGTKEHFHFKGIKVKAILDKAGLKTNAKNIKFVATDGYTQGLTVEQALREDYIDEQNPEKKFPVIIAWHENGKDFDVKKGAPFRLVVGQKEPEDMNKPQWVMNIAKIIVD